jgi:hypothetical protein
MSISKRRPNCIGTPRLPLGYIREPSLYLETLHRRHFPRRASSPETRELTRSRQVVSDRESVCKFFLMTIHFSLGAVIDELETINQDFLRVLSEMPPTFCVVKNISKSGIRRKLVSPSTCPKFIKDLSGSRFQIKPMQPLSVATTTIVISL